MPDLSPILAAGGIVGMFGVCIVLLVRLLGANNDMQEAQLAVQKSQYDELMALKKSHERCDKRVNILITVLNRNGITVPPEVWQ